MCDTISPNNIFRVASFREYGRDKLHTLCASGDEKLSGDLSPAISAISLGCKATRGCSNTLVIRRGIFTPIRVVDFSPFFIFRLKEESMSNLTIQFRARLDQERYNKLETLMQRTGYTPSQLLRALVDNAEVKSVPSVGTTLSGNANNTGAVSQAATGTFA